MQTLQGSTPRPHQLTPIDFHLFHLLLNFFGLQLIQFCKQVSIVSFDITKENLVSFHPIVLSYPASWRAAVVGSSVVSWRTSLCGVAPRARRGYSRGMARTLSLLDL